MHEFQFLEGGWMMFLWWFLIIALLIIIGKAFFNSYNQNANKKTPLDILKRRYASGEIDKEEFEKRKKDLL